MFFFGRKMSPLVNVALCLSTPKHNGKSGTEHAQEMQKLNIKIQIKDITQT